MINETWLFFLLLFFHFFSPLFLINLFKKEDLGMYRAYFLDV